MSKYTKKYLDIDVLQASKDRIKNAIELFDDYYVAFSGGKDSLVVLNLVDSVIKEMGITKKLKVIFRDEELIPDDVINFVVETMNSGRFDFRYFCIPLVSEKFILGKKFQYIQWDKNRKHIREIPKFAIKSDEVLDQYTSDVFCTQGSKGKIGIFTGIRCEESLVRLQAIMVKKTNSYITETKNSNINLIKPIYDWSEDDIFKYFYDNNIKYCQIYDKQLFNGEKLRVSTPLHAESAKQFYKVKTRYPIFYNQIIDIFPEMILQDRYYKEYSSSFDYNKYKIGWEGIYQYIDENIKDEKLNKLAKKRVMMCYTGRKNKKNTDNFGGYPILHIFKQIVNGAYKRNIMPKKKPTQEELEYEQLYESRKN